MGLPNYSPQEFEAVQTQQSREETISVFDTQSIPPAGPSQEPDRGFSSHRNISYVENQFSPPQQAVVFGLDAQKELLFDSSIQPTTESFDTSSNFHNINPSQTGEGDTLEINNYDADWRRLGIEFDIPRSQV